MKLKACSLFAGLFFALGSTAFSADIPITGEHEAWGAPSFTYYATPVVSGATYTWHVYAGTIVAQNTDPAAGPLYATIQWTTPGLYQDYVEIADNQGNSGGFDVYVAVPPGPPSIQQNPFAAHESTSTVQPGANVVKGRMYARLEAIGCIEEKRRNVA
jgi:hypothetical protein